MNKEDSLEGPTIDNLHQSTEMDSSAKQKQSQLNTVNGIKEVIGIVHTQSPMHVSDDVISRQSPSESSRSLHNTPKSLFSSTCSTCFDCCCCCEDKPEPESHSFFMIDEIVVYSKDGVQKLAAKIIAKHLGNIGQEKEYTYDIKILDIDQNKQNNNVIDGVSREDLLMAPCEFNSFIMVLVMSTLNFISDCYYSFFVAYKFEWMQNLSRVLIFLPTVIFLILGFDDFWKLKITKYFFSAAKSIIETFLRYTPLNSAGQITACAYSSYWVDLLPCQEILCYPLLVLLQKISFVLENSHFILRKVFSFMLVSIDYLISRVYWLAVLVYDIIAIAFPIDRPQDYLLGYYVCGKVEEIYTENNQAKVKWGPKYWPFLNNEKNESEYIYTTIQQCNLIRCVFEKEKETLSFCVPLDGIQMNTGASNEVVSSAESIYKIILTMFWSYEEEWKLHCDYRKEPEKKEEKYAITIHSNVVRRNLFKYENIYHIKDYVFDLLISNSVTPSITVEQLKRFYFTFNENTTALIVQTVLYKCKIDRWDDFIKVVLFGFSVLVCCLIILMKYCIMCFFGFILFVVFAQHMLFIGLNIFIVYPIIHIMNIVTIIICLILCLTTAVSLSTLLLLFMVFSVHLKFFGFPLTGNYLFGDDLKEDSTPRTVIKNEKNEITLQVRCLNRSFFAEAFFENFPQTFLVCLNAGLNNGTTGAFYFSIITSCLSIINTTFPYCYYTLWSERFSSKKWKDLGWDCSLYFSEIIHRINNTPKYNIANMVVYTTGDKDRDFYLYEGLMLFVVGFFSIILGYGFLSFPRNQFTVTGVFAISLGVSISVVGTVLFISGRFFNMKFLSSPPGYLSLGVVATLILVLPFSLVWASENTPSPTMFPSPMPSSYPSFYPSPAPSSVPTFFPTDIRFPTPNPSEMPSPNPSASPSNVPTPLPTSQPSSPLLPVVFLPLTAIMLNRNNLLGLISLPSNYIVSFMLYPMGVVPNVFSNIIHLTATNTSYGTKGARAPAVFFNPSSISLVAEMEAASATDKFLSTAPLNLPLFRWTNVSISIINEVLNVTISGAVIFSTVIVLPLGRPAWNNVYVYTASPWYPTANAQIKMLNVVSGPTIPPTSIPTTSPSTSAPSAPTNIPTINPSFLPGYPTPFPSFKPSSAPSHTPTNMPTQAIGYCPVYSGFGTANSTSNYTICGIIACPNTIVTVGNCNPNGEPGPECTGNQYLALGI